MSLTVAVVDDHAMFREALSFALEQHGMRVVTDACDAHGATDAIEGARPDVAVVGAGLAGVGGYSVAREVVRRRLRSKIVLLTSEEDALSIREGFAAGAAGVARKTQHLLELIHAIESVACGDRYAPPNVPRHLWGAGSTRGTDGPIGKLTTREREVLDLIVQGKTNKDTAAALSVSAKTIETHRASINLKLGVHSAAELMRFAALHGLLR